MFTPDALSKHLDLTSLAELNRERTVSGFHVGNFELRGRFLSFFWVENDELRALAERSVRLNGNSNAASFNEVREEMTCE